MQYFVIEFVDKYNVVLHGEFKARDKAGDKLDKLEAENFTVNCVIVSKEQLIKLRIILNSNISL